MGSNAIHAAAPILARLAAYEPRHPVIDGLEYREGLNAVRIEGGVAGNVIPDACTVDGQLPLRARPLARPRPSRTYGRSSRTAESWSSSSTTTRGAALPGLSHPAAAAFIEAVGGTPQPKYGWTDVSRFSALGVPAVNYGPGDPHLAHKRDERVETGKILSGEERLRAWLTS